jgi:hypothetical protein
VGLDVLPPRESRAGGCRHSDKEKFPIGLNHPEGLQNVGITLARIAKFHDFQAEYEGSIPFTRSKTIWLSTNFSISF